MSVQINGIRYLVGVGATDQFRPIPAKNEWGIDTLLREVRTNPVALAEYVNALRQGAEYPRNGVTWYLQSWQEIADPVWPGLRLFYKGLTSGIPSPFQTLSNGELLGTVAASSLSISWQGKTIVAAIRTIKYVSPQATYRYISNVRPDGARYTASPGSVRIIDSRISVTFSDGTTSELYGSAPAGLVSALTASASAFNAGPSATQVFGTPYWECEETVNMRYPE